MKLPSFKFMAMILFALVMLGACSSQPKSSYKPATNAGYGYKETMLGENYYRVEFKTTGNAKKAQSYALLRAAEITTMQGYDWFVVLKRDTSTDPGKKSASQKYNSRPVITRNCGLLGCHEKVETLPDLDNDSDLIDTDTTAIIEIKLGKGVRPALDNSYEARETTEKLQTQYPR